MKREFEYSKLTTKSFDALSFWPADSEGPQILVFISTDSNYVSISSNLSRAMGIAYQREEINKEEFDAAFCRAIKIIRDNHKE